MPKQTKGKSHRTTYTPKKRGDVKPEVHLTSEVLRKIDFWCNRAAGEVSGLGQIQIVDGNFHVTKVFLLKQDSSLGNTVLDQEATLALMAELVGKGHDVGTLRFWWHTHGSGDTFWSATDDEAINLLGKDGYMLSLVTNTRGDLKLRLGMQKPFHIDIDNLQSRVIHSVTKEEEDQWGKEYDDKVTEKTFTTGHLGGHNWKTRYGSGMHQSWMDDGLGIGFGNPILGGGGMRSLPVNYKPPGDKGLTPSATGIEEEDFELGVGFQEVTDPGTENAFEKSEAAWDALGVADFDKDKLLEMRKKNVISDELTAECIDILASFSDT